MVLVNYYCVFSVKCIYNVLYCSKVLWMREEFVNMVNLGVVDILVVWFWFDCKVVFFNLYVV